MAFFTTALGWLDVDPAKAAGNLSLAAMGSSTDNGAHNDLYDTVRQPGDLGPSTDISVQQALTFGKWYEVPDNTIHAQGYTVIDRDMYMDLPNGTSIKLAKDEWDGHFPWFTGSDYYITQGRIKATANTLPGLRALGLIPPAVAAQVDQAARDEAKNAPPTFGAIVMRGFTAVLVIAVVVGGIYAFQSYKAVKAGVT